jgi:hypothetical protein
MPFIENDWKRRYYDDNHLQFARDSSWDDLLRAYWGNEGIPADPTCATEGCDLPEEPFPMASISANVRSEEGSNYLEWAIVEDRAPATQTIAGYQIHRRTADGTFSSSPIAEISSGTFVYVDSNIADAESSAWCYQVKATNDAQEIVSVSNVSCIAIHELYLPLVR